MGDLRRNFLLYMYCILIYNYMSEQNMIINDYDEGMALRLDIIIKSG